MRKRKRTEGFTLIEVLLVVVIIGILAAIVVPRLVGRADDAKISAAKMDLRTLSTQLDTYKLDTGEYPTTEQGLDALVSEPTPAPRNWKGPYLRKGVPKDPWGNDYVYRFPGESETDYDLFSTGKDGQEATEDDIDAFAVEEDEDLEE